MEGKKETSLSLSRPHNTHINAKEAEKNPCIFKQKNIRFQYGKWKKRGNRKKNSCRVQQALMLKELLHIHTHSIT